MLKHRLYQFVIAFDQLFNVICFGWADETFSARCWRQHHKNRFWAVACKFVNAIFWWDKVRLSTHTLSHCEAAYLNEWYDTHKPRVYRGM